MCKNFTFKMVATSLGQGHLRLYFQRICPLPQAMSLPWGKFRWNNHNRFGEKCKNVIFSIFIIK